MVGLVLVSHSKALAEALVELVKQVAREDLPLAGVGGVGDDRRVFGTDATDVGAAIESVYSTDGVVVLMDLGSAILSAETALEFIAAERRPFIRFCDAPIVEGAIAAGVQISLGSNLETVYREARQALHSKTHQIGSPHENHTIAEISHPTEKEDETWQKMTLTVNTPHGLHARPAARFVQTAAAFNAEVRVRNAASSKGPVAATSLNNLATLGITKGDTIIVSTRGPQALTALDALKRLVEDELNDFSDQLFGAPATADIPASEENGRAVIAVSEGVAFGPLYHFETTVPKLPDHQVTDPEPEWERLQAAIAGVRRAIRSRQQRVTARLGKWQAAIFNVHLLMLQDPTLLEQIRGRIFNEFQNAAAAWYLSITEVAETYKALTDPYLQQRSVDVFDVGHQVLFELLGHSLPEALLFPHPVILVAWDLTPTQTAQLDPQQVLGLATVIGGPTSHSAILARAFGIPAVTGADPSILQVAADTPLAIDGFSGTLWVDPPPRAFAMLQKRRMDWLTRREELRQTCHQPAVTRDGNPLMILANVGSVPEARSAAANGAEGIGLLRTEFLYLNRNSPPQEAVQVDTLSRICEELDNRPVCVRTLDVGGDKAVPYLNLPEATNPYLGLRAIRLSLRNPALFGTQLRAILQAAKNYDIRIIFPMVSRLEEVNRALDNLEAAHLALQARNISHRWPLQTGIMIETPAAALLSSRLAKRVDFFSIGTNDLTQYTLAAERGNPDLADYADGLHPAVLKLIRQAVDAAHHLNKTAAICGELAADPIAVPVLVGLGIDELSMNPDVIPRIKALIRQLEFPECAVLAGKVQRADDIGLARRLAADFAKKQNLTF